MNKKTKSIIAGGAVALGVAGAALLGINNQDVSDETVTPSIGAVTITDKAVLPTEAIDNSEDNIVDTSDDSELTEADEIEYLNTDFILEKNIVDNGTFNDDDPLSAYRKVIEKDGVLIFYYENVPNELKPLLINNPNNALNINGPSQINTFNINAPTSVRTLNDSVAVTATQADISIVENYIFVQTANGLIYLSQITHGVTSDERINNNTFEGYTIYLNKTIVCDDWLPFKTFAGTFFGNNNTIYVSNISNVAAGLTIDSSFCESFSGTLSDLSIECNAPGVPFIDTARASKIEKTVLTGEVTYVINTSENTDITDCEIYATCNALIKSATSTNIKNTLVDNNMTVGMIETANAACVISDNIIASAITGDIDSRCGAFVGTLMSEITIKNNISTCDITVPTGYGGHAIGYVEYEYSASENIFGNYFDSYLTVEGTQSYLFIGNIDIYEITAALESLEKPLEMWEYAAGYINGNVVTTVYNLALIPEDFQSQWDDYNSKVEVLSEEKERASSSYEGFYDVIDIEAINEDNTTKIYELDGSYFFEKEELPSTLVIKNAVYSDGDVIIFLNQPVTNMTAIVATYKGEQMASVYYENVTGETVFVDTNKPEGITSVAIMIWESMASMAPSCPKYEMVVK